MRELLEQYDAWRSEGLVVGRAVVIRTYGSAPRQEGSVLLVAEDGRMVGSVSGGCVEGASAEAVDEARRTGQAKVVRYGISDDLAWSVGLACGGSLDVLVEPSVRDAVLAAARAQSGGGGPDMGATVVTALPADTPEPATERPGAAARARATLEEARRDALETGRSRTVKVEDRWVFIEAFPARPRL